MIEGKINPKVPTSQQEREFWEKRLGKGWGEEKPPDVYLMEFLDKYKEEIGPKVLDIGSGRGRHILPIAELGHDITGLELIQGGLDVTKNKLAAKGLEATLVQGDFRKLDFPAEAFNTAISIQVLNQSTGFEGAKQAFAEVGRVLKPGGLFFLRVRANLRPIPEGSQIVDEPIDSELSIENRGVTYIKARKVIENEEPTQEVLQHAFSFDELLKLADKNGMDIIDEFLNKEQLGEKSHWNLAFRKRKIV